jgi:hypothetical protein
MISDRDQQPLLTALTCRYRLSRLWTTDTADHAAGGVVGGGSIWQQARGVGHVADGLITGSVAG